MEVSLDFEQKAVWMSESFKGYLKLMSDWSLIWEASVSPA